MKTKGLVRFLSVLAASTAGISQAVVVNAGEFAGSPGDLSLAASGVDLAEGANVTVFRQGNGNGAPGLLVNGAVGNLGFNQGGVNGSNGGTAPNIFLDLGSSQTIGIVNVFSAGAEAGSIRQNQIFTLLGSNDPTVDISMNDLSAFAVIDSVNAINPGVAGEEGFGLTSFDLQGATFQFLALDTQFVSGAGGGETSIFHEIDVFEAIPEPSSSLLGLAGLGLMAMRRRR